MKKTENPYSEYQPKASLWLGLVVLGVLLSRQSLGYGLGMVGLAIILWEFDFLARHNTKDIGKLKGAGLVVLAIFALLLLLVSFWS